MNGELKRQNEILAAKQRAKMNGKKKVERIVIEIEIRELHDGAMSAQELTDAVADYLDLESACDELETAISEGLEEDTGREFHVSISYDNVIEFARAEL